MEEIAGKRGEFNLSALLTHPRNGGPRLRLRRLRSGALAWLSKSA